MTSDSENQATDDIEPALEAYAQAVAIIAKEIVDHDLTTPHLRATLEEAP